MKADFTKNPDALLPVIVQDDRSGKVLMLGYMNDEALARTKSDGRVTFFSRSRNRLWTKGESSGHFLELKNILTDCDNDTILIKAVPAGPVCHTGADTCFGESNPDFSLAALESVISSRKNSPVTGSYTASLFEKGINKIVQKVGEEAVELVIESKDDNPEKFLGEAADLLFHYLVLLQAKGFSLDDVVVKLAERHR